MPRRTSLPSTVLRALADWLRDHHDVVSVSELAALDVPRHYASSRVRSGRWQRCHEGVFVAHSGPLTYLNRCAAALAALGPDAALDADTAAATWGVQGGSLDRRTIHVLLPRGGRRRTLASVRIRYSAEAVPRAALVRQNMRVLRLERALVVMARRRPKGARGLLAFAVQKGHTTAERLRGVVLATCAGPGAEALLGILDDIAGGTRSELEGCYLDGARAAALPEATRNYPLLIVGRRVWLDLCYPALKIAIEIDGKAYHVLAEDWEDDLERQNDIVLDGWLVLRFSARALRTDAAGCMARVRRAIALRSADMDRVA